MQGQKLFTDKEVTRFRLSERVPSHNFYRRLAELVDWRFLYQETQALYSHNRPALARPGGVFQARAGRPAGESGQ